MSNNVKVMDAVRSGRNNTSKKDIQQLTGLSWGTMCKVTNALLERGCLFARKEKAKAPGRPVVPLCVNPHCAYFCGIDIGAAFTKLVFCDMNFNVLYRMETATPPYSSPERFLESAAAVFESALAESGIDRAKLHSIGLAVSGNVDSENGIIVSGGNFGMKFGANIPVSLLAGRIALPVYAITTQVAAVCAEYRFGKRAGCGNLVNIGLGVGIGSGIVANHLLLISHPKRPVGYIGHILIPGNEHIFTCGFKGCLESFSGSERLAQVAQQRGAALAPVFDHGGKAQPPRLPVKQTGVEHMDAEQLRIRERQHFELRAKLPDIPVYHAALRRVLRQQTQGVVRQSGHIHLAGMDIRGAAPMESSTSL